MPKNIELEVRGEIRAKDIPSIEHRLKTLGYTLTSTTRRTSIMSFGTIDAAGKNWRTGKKDEVDVRCRITNGKAEVVTKIGRTSAANRVEISVPTSLQDMVAFSRLFAAMPFFTKVGSKATKNYQKDPITISLVTSPSGLAYIEIEKMTDRAHEKEEERQLRQLAKDLGVTLWTTHGQFVTFCDRLTKRDDWAFHGTTADLKRLQREIKTMKSDRHEERVKRNPEPKT